ncbi:MAG: ComEC family competence protein [Candidatus Omnitrophota bacterium]|jgi:competence protein ComEC|nr:MAG: ComEC family competence protein [Candidatus Omnitrophota bacterium]
MKYISLWIALSFCLGLGLAFKVNLGLIQFYIPVIILFGFCFWCINHDRIFLLIIFFLFISLGAFALAAEHLRPDDDAANFISPSSREIILEGVVASQPTVYPGKVSFFFNVYSMNVDGYRCKCSGKFLAYMQQKPVSFGDRLLVEARLMDNPDSRKKRLSKIFIIKSCPAQEKAARGVFNFIWLSKLRSKISLIINSRLSPVSSALVNAMLLGLKDDLPLQLKKMFINTGTGHIISISGLHLSVIVFVSLIFLKLLRLPYALRTSFSVILLIFYCLFAGASSPLMRSTIMFTVTLLAYVLEREPDILNCLSLAALVILVLFPSEIAQPSFQFTFISMLAMIILVPAIRSLPIFGYLLKNKYLKFPVLLIISSLSVWAGLLPLSLYYFKTFSLIAVVANAIIVPYASLIVINGLIFIISALLFKDLSWVFGLPLELMVFILVKMIAFFDRFPAGHFHFT